MQELAQRVVYLQVGNLVSMVIYISQREVKDYVAQYIDKGSHTCTITDTYDPSMSAGISV